MKPTPDQTRRLLALPIEDRRKLLPFGPGWWIDPAGDLIGPFERPGDDFASKYDPEIDGDPLAIRPSWAWAPCDSAVWMEVGCPEGGRWILQPKRARIYGSPHPRTDSAGYPRKPKRALLALNTCPINCALAALEARHA